MGKERYSPYAKVAKPKGGAHAHSKQWTPEETKRLFELANSNRYRDEKGDVQWQLLQPEHFPDRTVDAVRNKYVRNQAASRALKKMSEEDRSKKNLCTVCGMTKLGHICSGPREGRAETPRGRRASLPPAPPPKVACGDMVQVVKQGDRRAGMSGKICHIDEEGRGAFVDFEDGTAAEGFAWSSLSTLEDLLPPIPPVVPATPPHQMSWAPQPLQPLQLPDEYEYTTEDVALMLADDMSTSGGLGLDPGGAVAMRSGLGSGTDTGLSIAAGVCAAAQAPTSPMTQPKLKRAVRNMMVYRNWHAQSAKKVARLDEFCASTLEVLEGLGPQDPLGDLDAVPPPSPSDDPVSNFLAVVHNLG